MNTSQLQRAIATLAGNLLCLLLLGSPLAQAADLKVYYLHTDHLDTPRLMTDEQNRVVWKNGPLTEPFGLELPNEDPDGDGVRLTLNLRFPGQYFDKETGLHYNYYRDYDPLTGRYMQSDPIGLEGGINTYAYVGGDPASMIDPSGLSKADVDAIYRQFEKTVVRMTKNKERTDNWIINNALPGYLNCADQSADVLYDLMINLGKTDDKWKFYFKDNFKSKSWWQPGHIWVEGDSSNPNDPHLKLDSWHHGFTMDYCKCGR